MTSELKPCPFCGAGAIKYRNKNGGTVAGCINEACAAERWSLPIQVWNTRAVSEREKALVDALIAAKRVINGREHTGFIDKALAPYQGGE